MICSLNLARPKFYLIYKTELILVLFLYPPQVSEVQEGLYVWALSKKPNIKKLLLIFTSKNSSESQ